MGHRRVGSLFSAVCVPLGAAVALASLATWLWTRPAYATASDTWSAYTVGFTAESLLDPSTRSVWSPGSTPAHVDIVLRGARTLRAVTVTNSDDFPHHDTSTDQFCVTLYEGDREVFVAQRRFVSPTAVETLEVDVVADRIRVTIESSTGDRGCLADVSWE